MKATGPAAKAATIDADTVKAAGTAEKEVDDAIGHVMMSYQWADQAIVKDIRDILRAQVIIIIIKVFLKRKVLSLETILNLSLIHI